MSYTPSKSFYIIKNLFGTPPTIMTKTLLPLLLLALLALTVSSYDPQLAKKLAYLSGAAFST
jgi:hypothetical protein